MHRPAHERAATILVEEARRNLAEARTKQGAAMACWDTHADELFLRREGATLHARVAIDEGGVRGLVSCLDMSSM